jgi:hypothetical protein
VAAHLVTLITCDLPNRKPLGEKSAMNGRCLSAQPITERSTVSATRNNGGLRRELTRLLMRCDFGGIRGTVELDTQNEWKNQDLVLCSLEVMKLLKLRNRLTQRH